MKIRADIAELLHAGHSDREIARRLHTCTSTVARARTALGLPKTKTGPKLPPLEDAFLARTRPIAGGHLEWRGARNNTGVPVMRRGQRIKSAYRLAFFLRTGREPDGPVRPDCGYRGCVAPAHVDDAAGRARYAAIFGEVAA